MSNSEAQSRMRQARAKRRSSHDTRPQSVAERREAFVREYLVDLNGTQVAIRAGYKKSNAWFQASRLLTDANIRKMIAEGKQRKVAENRETADSNLRRLELMASYDVRKLFNEHGGLKGINELDEQTQLAIKGVDFVNLYEGSGDQAHCFGQLRKLRLIDRLMATIKLGEHFGTFKQRPELEVEITRKYAGKTDEELRFRLKFRRWPEPGEIPVGGGSGSTDGTGASGDRQELREGPPLLADKLDTDKG